MAGGGEPRGRSRMREEGTRTRTRSRSRSRHRAESANAMQVEGAEEGQGGKASRDAHKSRFNKEKRMFKNAKVCASSSLGCAVLALADSDPVALLCLCALLFVCLRRLSSLFACFRHLFLS